MAVVAHILPDRAILSGIQGMKPSLKTQPVPTPEQAALLEACARKTANRIALQRLCYPDLGECFGLTARSASTWAQIPKTGG